MLGLIPFFMPIWDPTFIILIPGVILGLYAQFKVQSTFARYTDVRARSGITGAEVARRLLEQNRIHDVAVEQTPGHLGDHYDPREKRLRLSPDVYHGTSLAALGVAAHETGHAIQHDVGYLPLAVRSNLAPAVQIGSMAWFPIFLVGLFLHTPFLVQLGIYAFTLVVLFQLVTLPVEFNASSRAIAILESGGFLTREEVGPTRKVLSAAALTYVAALVMSILQLIRLLVISGMLGRRDD